MPNLNFRLPKTEGRTSAPSLRRPDDHIVLTAHCALYYLSFIIVNVCECEYELVTADVLSVRWV